MRIRRIPPLIATSLPQPQTDERSDWEHRDTIQSKTSTCAPLRTAFGTYQYKSLEQASRKKLMQFPQLFHQLRSV